MITNFDLIVLELSLNMWTVKMIQMFDWDCEPLKRLLPLSSYCFSQRPLLYCLCPYWRQVSLARMLSPLHTPQISVCSVSVSSNFLWYLHWSLQDTRNPRINKIFFISLMFFFSKKRCLRVIFVMGHLNSVCFKLKRKKKKEILTS